MLARSCLCVAVLGISAAAMAEPSIPSVMTGYTFGLINVQRDGVWEERPKLVHAQLDLPVSFVDVPLDSIVYDQTFGSTRVRATATASAATEFGHSHLYAYANAYTAPPSYGFGVGVSTSALSKYQDTFVVQPSAAHPLWSTVQMHATIAVDQTSSRQPGGVVKFSSTLTLYSASSYYFPDPLPGSVSYFYEIRDTSVYGPQGTLDMVGTFVVGAEYRLYSETRLDVGASAYWDWPGNPTITDCTSWINALNTTSTYFWSEDPSIRIVSASGASYTPEPTSMSAVLLVASGLLGRRRTPSPRA
jgi:hypothetical protein